MILNTTPNICSINAVLCLLTICRDIEIGDVTNCIKNQGAIHVIISPARAQFSPNIIGIKNGANTPIPNMGIKPILNSDHAVFNVNVLNSPV